MKFYEKIECEHGWTDDKGFAHCNMGTSCCIPDIVEVSPSLQILWVESYCTKEDCPIFEEE